MLDLLLGLAFGALLLRLADRLQQRHLIAVRIRADRTAERRQ